MSTLPFIAGEQLRKHLPYPELIDALRAAFGEKIHAPRRHVHQLSEKDSSTLLLMPVWQESKELGVKLVTVVPGNRDKGQPTVQALFILMDASTGMPLALMDGEQLTLRRTAAASALASGYLARPDSSHLLLVGTGQLTPHMAMAHCIAHPIETITVWGRDPEKSQHTLSTLAQAGLPEDIHLQLAHELSAATMQADIICCATTSKVPLVRLSCVKPGTHIDLVGGFRPDMREADDELIAGARIFVDTFDGALAEAGDLVQPLNAGRISRDHILAELADLATGRHQGRRNGEEITVFKSVGTAIEDLCAARLAWKVFTDNRPV